MSRWLGSKPEKCDICGRWFKSIFIDGATRGGPWVLMCTNCHNARGCGLGTGKGQKYDLKTLVKLEG